MITFNPEFILRRVNRGGTRACTDMTSLQMAELRMREALLEQVNAEIESLLPLHTQQWNEIMVIMHGRHNIEHEACIDFTP